MKSKVCVRCDLCINFTEFKFQKLAIARDKHGLTPLHAAVVHEQTEIIRHIAGHFSSVLNAPGMQFILSHEISKPQSVNLNNILLIIRHKTRFII